MHQNLNGHEAMALGAAHSGVKVAASYPGGPATGVVDSLVEQAKTHDIYVEWSSCEKVAFEVALGCSTAGARAAVIAKHVGINHIIDPLMTANLTGIGGGLVIFAGDDPGSYNSQNEQDSRPLASWAEIPMLEPSTPQQGYDLTRRAFEISERFQLPVMVRFVADFVTSSGPVETSPPVAPAVARFDEPHRYKCLPADVTGLHEALHRKVEAIAQALATPEYSGFNQVKGSGAVGIIAAGRMAAALASFDLPESIKVLELRALFPLPEGLIENFLTGLDEVYVLEEVEPYIENQVRIAVQKAGLKLAIKGKTTGHVPWEGDFDDGKLSRMLIEVMGLDVKEAAGRVKGRPSVQSLGWGCPYEPFFSGLKKIVAEEDMERPIVVGETGCLVRLNNPPLELLDIKFSMGSAVGTACGLRHAGEKRKIVAAMGDSVFFHTGINGVINAAHAQADIIMAVMDNGTVALTGFQDRIGGGKTATSGPTPEILPENLARGLGLEYVRVVDAYDREQIDQVWRECLGRKGPSFLVVRGDCPYIDSKKCQVDPPKDK